MCVGLSQEHEFVSEFGLVWDSSQGVPPVPPCSLRDTRTLPSGHMVPSRAYAGVSRASGIGARSPHLRSFPTHGLGFSDQRHERHQMPLLIATDMLL